MPRARGETTSPRNPIRSNAERALVSSASDLFAKHPLARSSPQNTDKKKPPKLRALASPTVRVGFFSTKPARARPARGVNDDQYHILGHLSTSFAAGMMSQHVIYRRYFLGRLGRRLFVWRAPSFSRLAVSPLGSFGRSNLCSSQPLPWCDEPEHARRWTLRYSRVVGVNQSLPLSRASATRVRAGAGRRASTSSGLGVTDESLKHE